MIFNKKGDLAISTNAIVVLIIAVIMLGLIIGFVTKGFGLVSNKFLAEAQKLPDPPSPSDSNPVTVTENIIANQGDQFGMKISVYNSGASGSFTPVPSCTDTAITFDTLNAKTIAPKGVGTFVAVGTISSTTTGKKLCNVVANSGSSDNADFIVEVAK